MTRQKAWKEALRIAKRTGDYALVIWDYEEDDVCGDRDMTYLAISKRAYESGWNMAKIIDSTQD